MSPNSRKEAWKACGGLRRQEEEASHPPKRRLREERCPQWWRQCGTWKRMVAMGPEAPEQGAGAEDTDTPAELSHQGLPGP